MFSVSFEENFQLLPSKHQELYKLLWNFCKRHHNVFPSHEYLARKANCSIRTVVTALKSFKIFGWIGWFRRCYRSNIYHIHSELLKKDPRNRKTFYKEEFKNSLERGGISEESCIESCRVYDVAKSSVATVRSKTAYVQHSHAAFSHKKPPNKQIVHPILTDLPFERADKLMIQRNFNERVIGLALASYKTYKYTPRRPIAFFLWLCKDAKKYLNKLTSGSKSLP